jgi:hypothetical protein
MPEYGCLSIAEIKNAFDEEITRQGGRVTDTLDDGVRLFARSILPKIVEVRPVDAHQGGVALRAFAHEIWVHPFTFRQICVNGTIYSEAIQTRHIDLSTMGQEDAYCTLRSAVKDCSAEDVFTAATKMMRTASENAVTNALDTLDMATRFEPELIASYFHEILDCFHDAKDRTQYGLMNAVTSIAREICDPQSRWRLEELGGSLAILPATRKKRSGRSSKVLAVR